MAQDLMSKLSRWYASHCDGEWEHHKGISIQTLDNPGWWVKIDLSATNLAERSFSTVSEGLNDEGFSDAPRWLSCRLQDGQWHGAGDETRLNEIIARFVAWVEME
jgi:Immunity protein 53